MSLEQRVAEWVRTRIGDAHMQPKERAMRLLEEAIELAQAEGITQEQVYQQTEHVFWRPKGLPVQEAAGVAVCLLGWCAASGQLLDEIALCEIERIEAKPVEQIRGSVARKMDADLVTVVDPDPTFATCLACAAKRLHLDSEREQWHPAAGEGRSKEHGAV
jgi:hypothetical protein